MFPLSRTRILSYPRIVRRRSNKIELENTDEISMASLTRNADQGLVFELGTDCLLDFLVGL